MGLTGVNVGNTVGSATGDFVGDFGPFGERDGSGVIIVGSNVGSFVG